METKTIVVEVESNLGSLKSQLREAQAEVSAMSEKFGATSVEAINAAKAAARLKDTIGDAKAMTDAFNPDAKFKALTASMSGALNGFQAVEGAMGLFGAEGAEVQKMLLKVQSAMALAQGVDGLLEAKDAFKTFGAQASAALAKTTAGQWLLTAAQTAGAAAMKVVNLVMNANPILLIVTGITALVGAFYLLVSSQKATQETAASLNTTLEKQSDLIAKQSKDIDDYSKLELARAKERGAGEEELIKIKEKATDDQIALNYKNYIQSQKTYDKITGLRQKDLATAEEFTEAKKKEQESYNKWQNSMTQRLIQEAEDAANKATEARDKEAEEEEKRREQAKAANDKYKADKKAALDSIKALEKEYNDSLLSDHDLEVQKVEEKYAKEIALAKKYKQDTETLEAARKTALNDIELRTEQARLKIIEDAEIAAAKIKAEALIEFNKTIKDIAYQNELNLLSEQEREIQLVKDKYTALEEAAKGNAEAMAVINEAKGAEQKVINDKYAKEDKDREDSVKNAKIQMTSDAIGVIGELATAFAGKSEASQKRAFNINKAASIAQATISTYQAAQSAYASQLIPGDPSSLIRGAVAAGISVASGIAKVTMIAKTQFNSNGGGGGGGDKLDSLPAAIAAATPANFNLVGNSGTNQLLQGLQNQPLQAFVVGGDVTSQQSLDRNRITTASI